MKNIFKKIPCIILSTLIALSLILGGCGSKTPSQNKTDKTASITVTDGLGRKIELKEPAKRVLTNYIIPVHMMFVLGTGDRLVAANAKGTTDNPLFKALSPNIVNTVDFKNKKFFNVESALALKPDLVLLNSSYKDIIDNAESHGLKVFAINAEDINGLKSTMENLGKALGKEKESKDFCDYYDSVISMIKKDAEGIQDKDKPVVYMAGSDLYSTAAKDMYQHSIIELAGGKNAGAELSGGWVKVSAEQIIKWNPDIILLPQYCSAKPADVLSNPALKGVNAVKNKKVYLFPSKLCAWDFPSPQAILGIEWLAVKINPQSFKDIDINKEADRFFNKFYGKNYSDFGEKLD